MSRPEMEVLTTPPTLDDIAAALKAGRMLASEDCKAALKHIATTKGSQRLEQFNFGPLKLDTVREAQMEAVEFVEFGCFKPPYPVCFYRGSIGYENRVVGMSLLVVDGTDKTFNPDPPADKKPGVATVYIVHSADEMVAMLSVNMLNTRLELGIGKAVEINVPNSEVNFWKPKIPKEDFEWNLTEGSLVSMGMTMILNTKGVLKTRAAPPAKPNKVRAAKGAPLLPYVTRVYTTVYNQAVAPGVKGTHASPRPHKRRAHVRHYVRDGKDWHTPIDAMLVNWDGRPLQDRETYMVK